MNHSRETLYFLLSSIVMFSLCTNWIIARIDSVTFSSLSADPHLAGACCQHLPSLLPRQQVPVSQDQQPNAICHVVQW